MLGSRKLNICPRVIKVGSIIGHRIDYNGPAAHTQQKLTQVPPLPWGDKERYPQKVNLSSVSMKV